MGKSWDNTGIANNVEMWKECLRVLKPGGHLLAFSGTRTYHRMAVAIEDAGFEVRDMIEWVYGSGFPKSHNIGKAVDKLQGNEREEFVRNNGAGTSVSGKKTIYGSGVSKADNDTSEFIDTKGTSEWEGWGTALKPAHEPICMARKPLDRWWKIKDDGKKIMGRVMTVAENVLKWGTGGINIDESRVGVGAKKWSEPKGGIWNESVDNGATLEDNPLGRFPANLIHDNSEEVRECFPETKSQGHWSKTKTTGFGEFGNGSSEYLGVGEKDKEGGNASRFFKSIIYTPKASKSERNRGCEGLEEKEEVYPGINTFDKSGNRLRADGSVIPPLKSKNNHPTVKPIALMEYLIKMVTPKGGIVLDPFAGSGTTGVACKNLNRNYILIEKEPEYIDIINKRLSKELEFDK
jgi:site-specific DNA-methyltransferase (adenine-specific)